MLKPVKVNIAGMAVAGAAVAVALSLAGCGGTPQNDDLRNVNPVYPNKAVVVMNVSGFPNVSVLCFHGTAFSTTSRQYDALTLTPSLNAWCATPGNS